MQTNSNKKAHFAKIVKQDAKKQIVYAEVYAPYTLDTYGDMMTPDEIVKAAHKYMEHQALNESIDTQHNYISNGSFPIESFIARAGDPDYTEGAWVLGVKVPEPDVWAAIERGDLNGFSMAGLAKSVPAVAEVLINVYSIGETELNDGHTHFFFVNLDEDGRVIGGRTSIDNNHAHEILYGTATEKAYGHAHRYFL